MEDFTNLGSFMNGWGIQNYDQALQQFLMNFFVWFWVLKSYQRKTEKKKKRLSSTYIYIWAGGVMVIVVGIGHDDTSSNSERDWLHFT